MADGSAAVCRESTVFMSFNQGEKMRKQVVRLAALAAVSAGSTALACIQPGARSFQTSGQELCPCPDEMSQMTSVGSHEESAVETFNSALVLSGGLPGGENVVTVHVTSFDYSINTSGPAVDAVISAGDTIHWVFDAAFHSATSVAGSAEVFDSGVFFNAGTTYDHTFNTPGTYQYYCSIHGFDAGGGNAGGMAGVITVRAVPEPTMALLPLLMLRRRR